jgi:hypothetical protein
VRRKRAYQKAQSKRELVRPPETIKRSLVKSGRIASAQQWFRGNRDSFRPNLGAALFVTRAEPTRIGGHLSMSYGYHDGVARSLLWDRLNTSLRVCLSVLRRSDSCDNTDKLATTCLPSVRPGTCDIIRETFPGHPWTGRVVRAGVPTTRERQGTPARDSSQARINWRRLVLGVPSNTSRPRAAGCTPAKL